MFWTKRYVEFSISTLKRNPYMIKREYKRLLEEKKEELDKEKNNEHYTISEVKKILVNVKAHKSCSIPSYHKDEFFKYEPVKKKAYDMIELMCHKYIYENQKSIIERLQEEIINIREEWEDLLREYFCHELAPYGDKVYDEIGSI